MRLKTDQAAYLNGIVENYAVNVGEKRQIHLCEKFASTLGSI